MLAFQAEALDFLGPCMEEFEGNLLLIYDEAPPELMPFREYWDFSSGGEGAARHNQWRDGLHCILHNWDGIYWEIFTVDEEERSILVDAHRSSRALEAYVVDFNRDFPTPRETELEKA